MGVDGPFELAGIIADEGNQAQAVRYVLIIQDCCVVLKLHQVYGYGWNLCDHDPPQRVCHADIHIF